MRYITSIERLAKLEARKESLHRWKVEGKIQLLQELLGQQISSDSELDEMSIEQLEALYSELRPQYVCGRSVGPSSGSAESR